MRVVAVADSITIEALRLMGIPGRAVATPEEASDALDEAITGEEVVLVAQATADMIREKVDRLKLAPHDFIVIEIPSPGRQPRQAEETAKLVSEIIGIKI